MWSRAALVSPACCCFTSSAQERIPILCPLASQEQYVAAARNLGSQKRLSLTDTRTEQEQEASGGADALQADEDALEDAPQQMRVNSQQRPSGQETVASQQLPRPSSVDSLDALEAKIGELGIHHEQARHPSRSAVSSVLCAMCPFFRPYARLAQLTRSSALAGQRKGPRGASSASERRTQGRTGIC